MRNTEIFFLSPSLHQRRLPSSSSASLFILFVAARRTLTSVWGRSWLDWPDLAVWPTLLHPSLYSTLLLYYTGRNQSSLHPHRAFRSCSGLFLLLAGGLGWLSFPTFSLLLEDKFGDFQYMARSPVAVDVQLAVGLGPSPISSIFWLLSRWLEGRPHTTLL